MSYQHVALIGKARSGKDTVAQRLVSNWAFTRVAFADPLKGMALRLNPLIPTHYGNGGMIHVRLTPLIKDVGWEYAKVRYPEVRRVLQHAGQSVRDLDSDFWANLAADKVDVADTWDLPVVVTDCRYPNEAEALKARGFMLVEVQRPGNAGTLAHESETALEGFPADRVVINDGSLFDLESAADTLVRRA